MFTPDNFRRLAPTLRVFETNLSQMKGLYRIHIYEYHLIIIPLISVLGNLPKKIIVISNRCIQD